MNKEIVTIVLTHDEFKILQKLAETEQYIDNLLKVCICMAQIGEKVELQMPENKLDDLRTDLTELLAKIGFDSDYSPTQEGRILEDLIDKLYKK